LIYFCFLEFATNKKSIKIMSEQTENKQPENNDTPSNTNNDAVIQDLKNEVSGFKKVIEKVNDFFSSNKDKNDKPEPPANTGDSGNKEVQELKLEFQKLLEKQQEDFNKKYEELKKTQVDAEAEAL
jgi:hypothetical protein